MNTPAALDVKCEDFLRDNRRIYARKAKRKKISIISLEATNQHTTELRVLFGESKLLSGAKTYSPENSAVVFRKLSEFTWDFLIYSIIDFHPVAAVFEAFIFLTGPLLNWRLKRQLKLLSDGELPLRPGERKRVLLAFPGVTQKLDELHLSFSQQGERLQVSCALG
jgi:hypothetical protein